MNKHNNLLAFASAMRKIADAMPDALTDDGGPGSGNFGHKGRPGKRGGSGKGGGKAYREGSKETGFSSRMLTPQEAAEKYRNSKRAAFKTPNRSGFQFTPKPKTAPVNPFAEPSKEVREKSVSGMIDAFKKDPDGKEGKYASAILRDLQRFSQVDLKKDPTVDNVKAAAQKMLAESFNTRNGNGYEAYKTKENYRTMLGFIDHANGDSMNKQYDRGYFENLNPEENYLLMKYCENNARSINSAHADFTSSIYYGFDKLPQYDQKMLFNLVSKAYGFDPVEFKGKQPAKSKFVIPPGTVLPMRPPRRDSAESPVPTADKPGNKNMTPASIAYSKRGQPMTHEQADKENANPFFQTFAPYKINCQTCVVAYEMRLRGYDVEALPKGTHEDQQRLAKQSEHLAWIDPATGLNPVQPPRCGAKSDGQFWDFLDKSVKQGERYSLSYCWTSGSRGGGHIISVDRDESGNLRLIDPQSGETNIGKSGFSRKFQYVIYETINRSSGEKVDLSPRLLRVDNLAPDVNVCNNILTPKNRTVGG